jgi:predicted nucleic acid-binding Zn ribbon protein
MQSLQSIVPNVLTLLLREGAMSQGKLEIAWRAAVGDALSRATAVTLLPDGVVNVQSADTRWKRELSRSSGVILSRLQTLLGADSVRRLSIQ